MEKSYAWPPFQLEINTFVVSSTVKLSKTWFSFVSSLSQFERCYLYCTHCVNNLTQYWCIAYSLSNTFFVCFLSFHRSSLLELAFNTFTYRYTVIKQLLFRLDKCINTGLIPCMYKQSNICHLYMEWSCAYTVIVTDIYYSSSLGLNCPLYLPV